MTVSKNYSRSLAGQRQTRQSYVQSSAPSRQRQSTDRSMTVPGEGNVSAAPGADRAIAGRSLTNSTGRRDANLLAARFGGRTR
jgi:hypothetical protein